MNLVEQMHQIGRQARAGARALARLTAKERNACLQGMADGMEKAAAEILKANAQDLDAGRESGLSSALLDRLMLDEKRLGVMIKAVRTVADFRDPLGKVLCTTVRPNGLRIQKISVPLGVIGMIYESRPNVTSDAASLCLKAGNAVVLRGGKEAIESNLAIARAMMEGGRTAGLPEHVVQVIPFTDREGIKILSQMDAYVDLIIPRGGLQLIEMIVANARVPVIKHSQGICHVYVDRKADLAMAEKIAINAKCQRPGVCNAMETLLVHKDVSQEFIPSITKALQERKVELRGDETVQSLVPGIKAATEEDWKTEYLDYILSIKVVDSLDQAIDHIETYGSHHTDAIITEDKKASDRFLKEVDSASVYVNASTRFTDGGEFGMGAEIGISTDKLHARGPMGLDELTTYKYVIKGDGQIRE